MPIDRTTFLIDGFNLYHSAVAASKDMKGASTKWLNIRALCESYLHLFGHDSRLEKIYYFSAFAYHKNPVDPDTVSRHRTFTDCLESTGIIKEMARFKEKAVWCDRCRQYITKHEEKETDVAISVKLIEVLWKNECDTAILMSGDTDISPAIRFVQKHFAQKRMGFLFPYKRVNSELQKLAPTLSFKMSNKQYSKFQFPNPFILPDGTFRAKPATW